MMKKSLFLLTLSSFVLLSGCSDEKPQIKKLFNGGFETSDLSGWEVVYGNAFNNDAVSSASSFRFKDDAKGNEISNKKEGNWYLSGKGFDDSFSVNRVGALKSNNFTLTGDGTISMKIAGGAITKGKGENAEYKPLEKRCFVGVYLAKNDQMIAMQNNDYFIEHTESYVDVTKYDNGVYNTDNFVDCINVNNRVGIICIFCSSFICLFDNVSQRISINTYYGLLCNFRICFVTCDIIIKK